MAVYEFGTVESLAVLPREEFQAARRTGREALAAGEAAPSLHRPVADISFPRPLWEAARYAVEITEPVNLNGLTSSEQFQDTVKLYCRSSAALQALVCEAEGLFRNIVEAETEHEGPVSISVTMGAYQPHKSETSWHRDIQYVTGRNAGAVTYYLPLMGPSLELGTGAYRDMDFDGKCLKPECWPEASGVHYYEIGTLAAYDSLLTPHRAPNEEYRGSARLLLSSFVGQTE